MKQTRTIIIIGICLGLVGVGGQVWLLRSTVPYAQVGRGVLFLAIAAAIGVIATFTDRLEPMKTAALGGFVAGFVQSWSTLFLSFDRQAFHSVELALARISAILITLALASWMTAGLAAIVAYPITQAFSKEGLVHEAN